MTNDKAPAEFDIAIVGAGAAGLFAAIHAARSAPSLRIVAVDGARTLGAKILVAGGGRCNVTHHQVSERDYSGGPSHLVRRVLSEFGVEETVAFFKAAGVELKREETGKLFPTTDRARSVLDALVAAAARAGVELCHPWRIESIERNEGSSPSFLLRSPDGFIAAKKVILATGGKSLPKSGSDGQGFELARGLGHSLTPLVVPALVPLTLPEGHWLRALSGLALEARIEVLDNRARSMRTVEGSVLCTHFGLSGPAILDVSRHWIHARGSGGSEALRINWLPTMSQAEIEELLKVTKGQSVIATLKGLLPERFLRSACAASGVDPASGVQQVPKFQRAQLAKSLAACDVPITGTRGFVAAETTAGGVPLTEIVIETMESRVTPGLFLCGEILDVDGRIGGFSFQWAWSSGYIAGCAAARAVRA